MSGYIQKPWNILGLESASHKANFSYRYHLFVDSDQTIAFHISVTLYGIEDGKKREIVHNCIVFVKTPPNPTNLNASKLLRFGVETPLMYGTVTITSMDLFVSVNLSSLEGV